ncbi:hypothetical protein SERLA73DRAFT_187983, partial [Serpula lacrymans var. lacrymans S7.3]
MPFYVIVDTDDNAACYIAARELVLDVASLASYKLASECIAECTRHHDSCPKPDQTILPTRVIDCSEPNRPKMVICTQGSYVALSYVWGETQPYSTTANIDSLVRDGLDIEKLPKTIKDAILSTCRLGLRYLWIDAFCILQDSRKDKNREIRQMRRIYRDAYVTIVAASAGK